MVFKWKEADTKKNENKEMKNTLHLVSAAQSKVKEDPTQALRLAQAARDKKNIHITQSTIHNIYMENYFYKKINEPGKNITYSAVSRGGRYILTADNDGNLRLWDRDERDNNGKLMPVCFENDKNTLRSIALSSEGDKFLTGDTKGEVQLWNVGDKRYSFNVKNTRINAMAFSPDGELVLIGTGDGVVRLYDLDGKKKGRDDSGKLYVQSVAFSPKRNQCIAGYEYGSITLFEVNLEEASISNKQKLPDSPHKESVGTAAFSHDGEYILTGSDDGTACLWDSKGNKKKEFGRYGGKIGKVAFSPDSKYLFIATKNIYVYLTELPEKQFAVLKGHTGLIHALTYNKDTQRLITFSKDGTIREWHLNGGIFKVLKSDKTVSATAFSHGFKYLFIGFKNGGFQLYNLETNNIITPGNNNEKKILAAVFLKNGKICTGSPDGTIYWWNPDGKLLESPEPQKLETEGDISALAISPDAKRILTYDESSKTAKLWTKNREGKFQKLEDIKFPDHEQWVSSIAFSPDGKKILTGTLDKTAILWKLKGPNPEIVKVFRGHESDVVSAAFSPDGTKILTGSKDETARLWDLHGNTLQVFKVHNDRVISAAFSTDGKYILTADKSGNICIWHTKMPLKDFLKKGNFEPLSDEQKQEYGIDD
jgi:WD40 repeat protein